MHFDVKLVATFEQLDALREGSHPRIAAAGELSTLAMLGRSMGRKLTGVRPYPQGLADLSPAQCVQLAKVYLRHIPEYCR